MFPLQSNSSNVTISEWSMYPWDWSQYLTSELKKKTNRPIKADYLGYSRISLSIYTMKSWTEATNLSCQLERTFCEKNDKISWTFSPSPHQSWWNCDKWNWGPQSRPGPERWPQFNQIFSCFLSAPNCCIVVIITFQTYTSMIIASFRNSGIKSLQVSNAETGPVDRDNKWNKKIVKYLWQDSVVENKIGLKYIFKLQAHEIKFLYFIASWLMVMSVSSQ